MPPVRLAPWSQVDRLTADLPAYAPDDAEPLAPPRSASFRFFVSSVPDARGRYVVRHDAPVAFLTATGHLVADDYGIRDVVPFTGRSVFTVEQLDEAIERLRAAGGSTVLVQRLILPRVAALLARRGFAVLTASGLRAIAPERPVPDDVVTRSAGIYLNELTKWVDARALRGGVAG